jgi:hypothetical protein
VGYVGRVEWGFTRERLEELVTRGRPTDVNPFGGAAPLGLVFFQPGVVAGTASARHCRESQLEAVLAERALS